MADEEVKTEEINYKDKYLYLLADFENYKKRILKDIELLKNDVSISMLTPFLEVNDCLSIAKESIEKSDNIESIKNGIDMIIKMYSNVLSDLKVEKIKTVGEKFDPSLHHAVQYQSSRDVKEGYIISEVKGGYLYKDKVIYPSNVIVSSGK